MAELKTTNFQKEYAELSRYMHDLLQRQQQHLFRKIRDLYDMFRMNIPNIQPNQEIVGALVFDLHLFDLDTGSDDHVCPLGHRMFFGRDSGWSGWYVKTTTMIEDDYVKRFLPDHFEKYVFWRHLFQTLAIERCRLAEDAVRCARPTLPFDLSIRVGNLRCTGTHGRGIGRFVIPVVCAFDFRKPGWKGVAEENGKKFREAQEFAYQTYLLRNTTTEKVSCCGVFRRTVRRKPAITFDEFIRGKLDDANASTLPQPELFRPLAENDIWLELQPLLSSSDE